MKLKFPAQLPKPADVRARVLIALLVAAGSSLGVASSALADSSTSSNWAGYAAHRSNVRFRQVSAMWRQPSASCKTGNQTYSAVWVGLGGFNQTSNALEQIGTEVDCSAAGHVLSSAWYELVPAPSAPIALRVRPGDLISASVTVVGHRVDVKLSNLTTHRTFARTLRSASIDVSSAEWIVEAPSDCISANACQTLPLANFGTATFSLASAKSTGGVPGSISNRAWDTTAITLAPGGRHYATYRGTGPYEGVARPSGLAAAGSVFSVSYAKVSVESNPFFAPRRSGVGAVRLVHPGR
jgi:hypothetical protein